MALWKVRALVPMTLVNAVGRKTEAPVGRLGWLPETEATKAAKARKAVILSPAGLQYNTRVQVADTTPVSDSAVNPEPEIEAAEAQEEEAVPEAPKPAVRRPRAPYTTRT